ncbi:MAG: hypothetical protein ACKO7B_01595, partial [Flavobacteriales bacterium]
PNDFNQYYNYMRGIWKDQSQLVYGGTGYQTAGYDSCNFMFPGDTDPNGWGTKGVPLSQLFPWSETEPLPGAQPNTPSDRRFIQTAGPFTLQPGAVNYVTTGVVWARSTSGGALASLKLVRLADDKAQLLFNNCFKVIDGPDAPEMAIREMDRELIVSIINPDGSNNYREEYAEDDKEAQSAGKPGSKYRFEFSQMEPPLIRFNGNRRSFCGGAVGNANLTFSNIGFYVQFFKNELAVRGKFNF